MLQEVEKKPKIALCRKCCGSGRLPSEESGEPAVCPQCEGTGRVTVSARMVYDIRPYRGCGRESGKAKRHES